MTNIRIPILHALTLVALFVLALVAIIGVIVADEHGRKVPEVLANVVMLIVGAIIGFLVRLPTNGSHRQKREEDEHGEATDAASRSGPAMPQQRRPGDSQSAHSNVP